MLTLSAWQESVFRVILVRIFSHLDCIQRDTKFHKFHRETPVSESLFNKVVSLKGSELCLGNIKFPTLNCVQNDHFYLVSLGVLFEINGHLDSEAATGGVLQKKGS